MAFCLRPGIRFKFSQNPAAHRTYSAAYQAPLLLLHGAQSVYAPKPALTDLAPRFGQPAFVFEPVVDYESSRAGLIKRDLPSGEVRSLAAAAGLGVFFLVAGLIGASKLYE